MALAILRLLAFEKETVRFAIDTGNNPYYRLQIGKSMRHSNGIDWVADVVFATPLARNKGGGSLLGVPEEISLPISNFEKGHAYVQLFSFKTPNGKSPAFSRVIKVPMGLNMPLRDNLFPSISFGASMNAASSFQPARKIPCCLSTAAYSQQTSIEDLLGGIIKVATPIVIKLLSGEQNKNSVPVGTNGSQADILGILLKTILEDLSGKPDPVISQSLSLNRFAANNPLTERQHTRYSQPFIFGIDDALLGMLIGPVLQVLPQLVNAGNQERIQMREADNKLVSEILANDNRRMLIEKLQEAQQKDSASNPQGNTAELNLLMQLLQQAQPQTIQNTTTGAKHVAKKLSLESQSLSKLSKKAVVSFVTAASVSWNGIQKVLYEKNKDIQLNLSLIVGEPVPRTALPRAIINFIFKDNSSQLVLYEKSFKQKDVLPNKVMRFTLTASELASVPANKSMTLFAEIRWLGSQNGQEFKALGSSEIILVNQYFLKEVGKGLTVERELTDMGRFRPFWNKIWEAPLQDANGETPVGRKKHLWELDVTLKYSVLLTEQHETNGVMETKVLLKPPQQQSLSEKTEGRMKAGNELSVAELNKLLPLWKDEIALNQEKLAAINTQFFSQNNSYEFTEHITLKGRARERGMVWVVPIFKLFELTLNAVARTDESGQVVAVTEEKVRFPLPVSARVIGLKSQ